MTPESSLLKREIEKILGHPDSTTGSELNYRCQWCASKGRSSHLHVNYERGMATCHECKGGAKSLAGLLTKLGGEVPTNIRVMHEEGQNFEDEVERAVYGEVSDESEADKAAKPEKFFVALPDGFRPFSQPRKSETRREILRYLTKERGVPLAALLAIDAGYVTVGRMAGYAIFPVLVNGERVMWTSRICPACGDGPKVLHSKGGQARRAIFNYDACRRSKRLFICEGPFDAWWMHGRLLPTDGGMCLFGTNVTNDKLDLIAATRATEVVVMLDGDAAGQRDTLAAARKIAGTGKRVRIAVLPEGKDPDELTDRVLGRCVRRAKLFDEEFELEALFSEA